MILDLGCTEKQISLGCLALLQDKEKIIDARKPSCANGWRCVRVFTCGHCGGGTMDGEGGISLVGLCWNCIKSLAKEA